MNKETIYNEFYKRKYSGEKGVALAMAKELDITKQRLYQILKEAQTGETQEQRYFRLHKEKLEIMWNEKFIHKFTAIPKDRKAESVKQRQDLAQEMIENGYSIPRTAELLQYADATTLYKFLQVC